MSVGAPCARSEGVRYALREDSASESVGSLVNTQCKLSIENDHWRKDE